MTYQAVKNWYNNARNRTCTDIVHTDEGNKRDDDDDEQDDEAGEEKEEDDAIPGTVSNNPFIKMLKGRAKTTWKHWWEISKDPDLQKAMAALPGTPTIGQKAQVAKAEFEKMSEDDQAEWARRAAEASKLPVDQCFMYVA